MISLNLLRPLAFIDLETTGINIATDRIIEIAILKIFPDGSNEIKVERINPTIPIPFGASKVHGIYDKDVADKPAFVKIAPEIQQFIEGCDFAGYNSNRFDIPLLLEEFLRAGIDVDISQVKLVDVLGIFQKMEQRNLAAAYKFYCDKELLNAHNAEADISATYEIFLAQLERYSELKNDVAFLHEFSAPKNNNVDLAGKIVLNEQGVECINFGKHKGKTIPELLRADAAYIDWMMKGDFPLFTKKVLTDLKKKYSGV